MSDTALTFLTLYKVQQAGFLLPSPQQRVTRSPRLASKIVAALLRGPDRKIGPFSSILKDFLLWGLEVGGGVHVQRIGRPVGSRAKRAQLWLPERGEVTLGLQDLWQW